MVGGVLLVLVPLDINVLVMVVIRVLLQPCQVCAFAHFLCRLWLSIERPKPKWAIPKIALFQWNCNAIASVLQMQLQCDSRWCGC